MVRYSFLLAALFHTSCLLMSVESFVARAAPSNNNNNKSKKKKSKFFMFQGDKTDTSTTDEPTTNPKQDDDYQVQTRNPLRLLVLRLGLTEPAMTSPFNYGKFDGTFNCAYCGAPLFDSTAKYDSGSGWPSFWRSAQEDAISYKMEFDGRLECRCKRCSSHLGHVFLDGPQPASVSQPLLRNSPESDPRGKSGKYLPRFCINGAAMTFDGRDDEKQS